MNALETHIALDLRIDDIDSSRYDHITPHYKDLVINDMTKKFIEKRYNAYKESKDINELVRQLGSTVEQDIKRLALLESDTKQYCNLPANVAYYLESRSLVANRCATTKEEDHSEYIAVLEFIYTETGHYTLSVDGESLFSTANLSGYTSIVPSESFLVRDLVLFNAPKGVNIYWEQYGNVSKRNSFIVVTPNAYTALSDGTSQVNFVRYVSKKITADRIDEAANREHKAFEGELHHYLNRPFSVPTRKSPVVSLSKNRVNVHTKNFKVTHLVLSYIRRPRPINHKVTQSSELPEDTQLEIVDMAAQFIKAILADPNFQVIALENKVLN